MPAEVSDDPGRGGKTAFTRAVRRVVRGIPAGEVASYGQVAARAGFPGAARAVGAALDGSIPWWRVVRSDGSVALGERQADLLRAEGVRVDGSLVADPRRRRRLRAGMADAP